MVVALAWSTHEVVRSEAWGLLTSSRLDTEDRCPDLAANVLSYVGKVVFRDQSGTRER